MKSAAISFLLTLAAVIAGFLSFAPGRQAGTSSSSRVSAVPDSSQETSAAPADASSDHSTPVAQDANRAKQLDSLAEKARVITQKRNVVENLVAWWDLVCEAAELDPLRAIAMVRQAPENFLGDKLHSISGTVEDIVAWWAAHDPAAALAWYWKDAAQRQVDDEPPVELLQTLARRDVNDAIRFARHYLELAARQGKKSHGFASILDGQRMKTNFFMSGELAALIPWMKTLEDFDRLLPLAEAVADPGHRAGFHQSLTALVIQTHDVTGARRFLERHPLPADWPDGFAHPVATLTASAISGGADAAEWITWGQSQLSARPDLERHLATEAIAAWAKRDPGPAGDWLQTFRQAHPESAVLPMRAYAAAVLAENPPAAMEWITALPDETARRQNMLLHFPKWAETDPAAARAWLDTSLWPAEIKRLAGAVLPL